VADILANADSRVNRKVFSVLHVSTDDSYWMLVPVSFILGSVSK